MSTSTILSIELSINSKSLDPLYGYIQKQEKLFGDPNIFYGDLETFFNKSGDLIFNKSDLTFINPGNPKRLLLHSLYIIGYVFQRHCN